MKHVTVYLLVLTVLYFALVNGDAANLDEIISQLCTSWGGSMGRHFSSPRVGKAGPRGVPGPRGLPGAVNETAIRLMMREEIDSVLHSIWPRTCRDVDKRSAKIRNETGGVYNLYPLGLSVVEIYCDETTDGGGWTVFQRRMDGSVDFYRGWNDYVNGFGYKHGEFWLGLEAIHQMTKNRDHELRIDMIRTDGTRQYAKYGLFTVGAASDHYRLYVSGYSGNTTHDRILDGHNLNGMQFSTKDGDHDIWSKNCASVNNQGAWWYKQCTSSDLNGVFGKSGQKGIWWHPYNLRFTEMKVRRKI